MSIIGDAVAARPRKIQVLNEIVKILREHIDQREEKIDGLENLVYLSKEKIKSLEEQLSTDEDWVSQHVNVSMNIFNPILHWTGHFATLSVFL